MREHCRWVRPTQVGSLGQVLTDESVGVLVGAPLPGMVRRRKVDLCAQDVFQFLVVMKLGPIVRSDGLSPAGVRPTAA